MFVCVSFNKKLSCRKDTVQLLCGLVWAKNTERFRCKYRYKQAIKVAMQENDRSFNDDLYDHLCQKDENSFWKAWRKRFCSNSLKPTNVLNGKVGTDNVLSEFTSYCASTALPL